MVVDVWEAWVNGSVTWVDSSVNGCDVEGAVITDVPVGVTVVSWLDGSDVENSVVNADVVSVVVNGWGAGVDGSLTWVDSCVYNCDVEAVLTDASVVMVADTIKCLSNTDVET